jgi:hypothetical protein
VKQGQESILQNPSTLSVSTRSGTSLVPKRRPRKHTASVTGKMLSILVGGVRFMDVAPSDLRCAEKKYLVEEGYGRRRIENWPPFSFFKTCLEGDRQKAFNEFALWYWIQFSKYSNKPKKDGGMKNGSLYRTLERNCLARGIALNGNARNVDKQIVMETIHERVRYRLDLFDSIVSFGYNSALGAPVKGIAREGRFYLRNGHHRSAILTLLKAPAVPDVLVFPSYRAFAVYNKLWKYFQYE